MTHVLLIQLWLKVERRHRHYAMASGAVVAVVLEGVAPVVGKVVALGVTLLWLSEE